MYDIDKLKGWLEALDERELLGKSHILVGIGPVRSLKTARFLQEHIPDVSIPQKLLERMESSSDPKRTGVEIALELIHKVKNLPGVSGIHIMSMGWESIIPQLVREIGLSMELSYSNN